MKKLFVMFALVSFAFVVNAADDMNYVSVKGKTYFSDDVKIGSVNVRFATEDGLTLKAPLKKVNALMVDGKLYERLPLICCKGNYKGTALLEFMNQRNGLRLYRYHPTNVNDNLGCCFYDQSQNETMFFIYQDGKLYLRIDEKNAETVFAFFRVNYKNKS
jgi:hypothetical protein